MKLIIHPAKKLSGEATPPSSKSHSVRGVFIATLAKGTSTLHNVLDAEDGRAAIEVCKGLGAKIDAKQNSSGGLEVTVKSEGMPLKTIVTDLFSSNSGITTTISIPLIGLREDTMSILTLASGEQMQKRPLATIIQAVKDLGMEAISYDKNDSCPLGLSGNLTGGYCALDGSNSQNVSALLISLPCAEKDSEIVVKNLQERPYMEMTLTWLDNQKIRYEHTRKDNIDTFKIFGNQQYRPFIDTIPGDFSSASYLIAAAVLLEGEITLHGLDMDDPQGDKGLIPVLQQMGADIKIAKSATGGDTLKITGGKPLKGTTIDCSDMPDMLPTLAVIATQAEGKTTLMNAGGARIKETDRLKSMATELAKMGIKVEENESSLVIHQGKLKHANLKGYSDHRTIMALAIAGLLADGQSSIDTAEGINKTFPGFRDVMESIGAKMDLNT